MNVPVFVNPIWRSHSFVRDEDGPAEQRADGPEIVTPVRRAFFDDFGVICMANVVQGPPHGGVAMVTGVALEIRVGCRDHGRDLRAMPLYHGRQFHRIERQMLVRLHDEAGRDVPAGHERGDTHVHWSDVR